MAIILSHSFCVSQVQKLRDAIQEKSGIRYPILTRPNKQCKVFLRYGTTVQSPLILEDTDMNSLAFIATVCRKNLFADFCTANGIFAPTFSRNTENVTFPAVIRETLTGFHGQGIHVVETLEEFNRIWRNHFWWTPYVPMKKEYRAHVINGNLVKIFEKIGAPDEKYPIRTNAASDWSIRNPEKFVELIPILSKISETFPHHFMGLDVGRTLDGRYFVLEANSAPGISTQTAGIFADFLLGENR